ncbi:MAG: four helix bundle protein [Bacteroidetes bacterium]|nr:four helix bundle protein [Bacteroidota bacterium]
MEKSKSFQDLIVWQKAHKFVLKVYEISKDFPKNEIYGLTSQFRRAAVSIAANIVEGFAKKGIADKLRFYNIAQGSIQECQYYILLSKDLDYHNDEKLKELLKEVSKLIYSYMKSLKTNTTKY